MYYVATFLITNTKTNRRFVKKVGCWSEDHDTALFEAYDMFESMRETEGRPEWRLQGPGALTLEAKYA